MKRKLSIMLALVMVLTSVLGGNIFAASDTYTVKEGDVLWKIARDNGTDWETLAEVNNLKNPNLIFPGQILELADYDKKITLLHTNDMHGFFVEDKYAGMGAAKLKTVFDMYDADKTLILDAGDATQGNNMVNLSEGDTAVNVLNALGYDAMTVGNHEFDYGQEQLEKNIEKANFPVVAANIKKDGVDYLTPYVIKEVDGVKVAIFGLATPETKYKSHPDNSIGLTFDNPTSVAASLVPTLEGMADVIVCLAHLGDEGMYTAETVANAAPGIDVIIDGHSHSTYETGMMVGSTLIASSGEKTENVGIIEIEITDGMVSDKSASLFTKSASADIEGDATVAALIDEIKTANAVIENEVVATTDSILDGEREHVRTGETNLGNLIAESLKDISGADVALTNGGGIRASIDVGDITKGEVLTVLPYSNTVRVIELTGADLIDAIEHGVAEAPETNGAFPHIAGMMVEYDSSKEVGSRVVSLTVGGVAVDEAATYTLATNDFLAAGGDDYEMFEGKNVVAEYGTMDEVLTDYINANGTAGGALTERIKDVAVAVTGFIGALLDAA